MAAIEVTRVTVYDLMIFRLLIEGGIYFLQRLLQISCNYVVKVTLVSRIIVQQTLLNLKNFQPARPYSSLRFSLDFEIKNAFL